MLPASARWRREWRGWRAAAATFAPFKTPDPTATSRKDPEIRERARLRAQVLGEGSKGYRVRLEGLDQEVDCPARGVRWREGQQVKVRVVRVVEGRVKEVAPA